MDVRHSERMVGSGGVHKGEWRGSEHAWMGTVGFQGTGRGEQRIYKHAKGNGE